MKRVFLFLFALGFSFAAECPVEPSTEGPVNYYGKLKAREGMGLIDGAKTGKAAQIRGVSFFWSQWSDQFYNASAVERLAKDWKAEVVRAAYGATGSTAAADRQSIKTVVEAAIDNDIYVIIDWHSHTAHNSAETERAINFF
ncbi:MAG: glycoside hydrolase family 5 protein, partial [Candidatus Fibromonas sp.]|nr:glycoside hydrolase family 5 protein [Candidatus Fibromonas sp.]